MDRHAQLLAERANIRHLLLVIGGSLGATRALEQLLSGLDEGFSIPIAVALHRHPQGSGMLGPALQAHTHLPVWETDDKQPIAVGVFLAPADYHLLVDDGCFNLSLDAPVSYARPSVDVLFESAAKVYGKQLVGVVLTGANHDGAQGVLAVRQYGGLVLAQSPESAEAPQMPKAAVAAGAYPIPLSELGPLLSALHGGPPDAVHA